VSAARKTGEQAGKQTEQKQAKAADERPLVGVYEATEDLFINGVRAFNTGDRVPAEHVSKFDWADKVRRIDEED
jgi:hypothetical protein